VTCKEGGNIDSQAWIDALREQGYRLTDARKAVVDVVAHSQCVLRPAEVYDIARQRYPKLGLVTVYRTIEKLEELGLIQRVHREQDCQAFVATHSGHQHLLLCTRCGKYVYFEGADLGSLFTGVEQDTGFVTQDHWMQIFGICPQCQREMGEDQ
jgi:Fur family transcriptional regulator, ferric uptake regulator